MLCQQLCKGVQASCTSARRACLMVCGPAVREAGFGHASVHTSMSWSRGQCASMHRLHVKTAECACVNYCMCPDGEGEASSSLSTAPRRRL